MKIRLFISSLIICLCSSLFAQSPSNFFRLDNADTVFGQNVPKGTILLDLYDKKQFLVLEPLGSSKTINLCSKLLLDGTTIDPVSATLAELKEVGTNSSSHYVGELIDGGIAVEIWTQGGVEKVLLADMVNKGPSTFAAIPAPTGSWRLPTIWELNSCFNAGLIVNSFATEPFLYETYWSSSVAVLNTSYYTRSFITGLSFATAKGTGTLYTRFVKIH